MSEIIGLVRWLIVNDGFKYFGKAVSSQTKGPGPCRAARGREAVAG
jgi:hypothetical protein